MLTVEEAQQIVLDNIHLLGVERVSLLDALGRVLAADVPAAHDNPPMDNSAMDGYAVRFADIRAATAAAPTRLQVVEDIPAGTVGKKTVGPGQASRIMTGAPVPAGADTVVQVEGTRGEGDKVEILDPGFSGAHIRRRGEDMKEGEVLIAAGSECGPGEVGVLASAQRTFLPVYRRPTVSVLSTGDELVEIDEPLEPGKIVNSNSTGLAAMCRAHGAVPVVFPIIPDDEGEMRRSIEAALTSDFVISSGGVSVGDYDYVKQVLTQMGAEELLWRVAMKPGKPLYFCLIGGKPYFGLPGNPVSSLLSFLQFVRPAIRKATGHPPDELLLPSGTAHMEHSVHNRGDRRRYLRARLRFGDAGQLLASTTHRAQGSHVLTSMLGTNGIVVLDPEEHVEEGGSATVQIAGDLR